MWPASLQHLEFGLNFNRSMEGAVLPASLQELTFGDSFNHQVTGVV